MSSQLSTYVLGGIFVVVITILGTSVSQTLLKQDQVVSFESPMQEFVDTLGRELNYNDFALQSLAQLFRSSHSVEAHEFASFTALVMKRFSNIVAMTYLAEPSTAEAQNITQTYWQDAKPERPLDSSFVLMKANIAKLYKRTLMTDQAVASPIFKLDKDNRHYSFVLLRVSERQGGVGFLVDVGHTLEQILNNEINQGYSLFEREQGQPRLVFSKHNKMFRGEEDVISGDFVSSLAFFNRQWLLSIYQNQMFHHKVAYSMIPIGGFALSLLVVYLVIQGQRLQAANQHKQSALKDLKYAQKRLIESEKLSAMGGVVAGVAHEVNTPLGIGITSMTHLQDSMNELRKDFSQGRLDAERFTEFMDAGDEMVSLSLNNLYKASSLVAKFKKVDVISTDSDMATEPVSIAELVEDFIVGFYNDYPGSSIKIVSDVDENAIVNTYPGVLVDIFNYLGSNVVTHAFKPGQKDCQITITYPYRQGNKKTNLLLFKDNGTGVEKNLLKRIFDPFFTTCRGAGNAGLGLSVVYNLVKGKLNSDLTIYVDEGLALTFELHDLNK